jgi:hypothetical protein
VIDKPDEIIALDFPLSGSKDKVTAKVGFWDDEFDLAELIMVEDFPAQVMPTSMCVPDELWDHRVQAFGFPSSNMDGTWADCQLRGPNLRGWIEVFDPNITGNFIKQGFSGGPVWDSKLEHIIGIIVAVERNENARVGYLIPAHKILERWQELPVSLPGTKAAQQREIPDLIPYLVNRQKQDDELFKLYKDNDPQNPLPMVVIVHGDDMQAADMFRLKMASQSIPRLLKINPRQTPIMEFPFLWPNHIEKAEYLGSQLTRSLGEVILSDGDASCEEIQKVLASYNSPVILETELLTKDWVDLGKNGGDVLKALFDFWNDWPTLAPRQNLFVFIYITHKIPNLSQNKRRQYRSCQRRVFTQLEQCTFSDFVRIRGTVLSELKNISETETRHWARTVAREHFHGEIPTLIAKIGRLFENEEAIAMEPLAFKLKEILASAPID